MMTTISKQEAEIADSITATDKQLAEVNTKLGALCLAKQEQDETEDDRASAIGQVAVEQTVLVESRKLLEQLLSGIHTAAMDARREQAQAQVVNNFGAQNEGMQVGVSYGAITFTPSKK
jgi:septal ring factor EnvC (AmiA/AmiB activator)